MSENVLSVNKRRALAALMAHPTIAQAAEACGLTARQITRYLTDADFRQALRTAQDGAIDAAAGRLAAGSEKALAALEEVLDDKSARHGDRLRAAQIWLDAVLRWHELRNLAARIEALEAQR